jgi:hypothetical protein
LRYWSLIVLLRKKLRFEIFFKMFLYKLLCNLWNMCDQLEASSVYLNELVIEYKPVTFIFYKQAVTLRQLSSVYLLTNRRWSLGIFFFNLKQLVAASLYHTLCLCISLLLLRIEHRIIGLKGVYLYTLRWSIKINHFANKIAENIHGIIVLSIQ